MQTQSKNNLISKNKLSKEPPNFTISLNFSNNTLQIFILDIFEKLKINISLENILNNNEQILNLIKVDYKNDYFFLMFFDSNFLKNSIKSKNLFKLIEIFQDISSKAQNISFVFYDISEKNFDFLPEIIFYLTTKAKIKIFKCDSNLDLYDFIENFICSITIKEEKAKSTFFDLKPAANVNLSDLDSINENTRIWVKHLMCIPGISEKKALSVVKIYPDFKSLIEVYESSELNDSEKEKLLKDITPSTGNSSKRLGEVISSRIYRYYMNKEKK